MRVKRLSQICVYLVNVVFGAFRSLVNWHTFQHDALVEIVCHLPTPCGVGKACLRFRLALKLVQPCLL